MMLLWHLLTFLYSETEFLFTNLSATWKRNKIKCLFSCFSYFSILINSILESHFRFRGAYTGRMKLGGGHSTPREGACERFATIRVLFFLFKLFFHITCFCSTLYARGFFYFGIQDGVQEPVWCKCACRTFLFQNHPPLPHKANGPPPNRIRQNGNHLMKKKRTLK